VFVVFTPTDVYANLRADIAWSMEAIDWCLPAVAALV
jgi:hypothetical protein